MQNEILGTEKKKNPSPKRKILPGKRVVIWEMVEPTHQITHQDSPWLEDRLPRQPNLQQSPSRQWRKSLRQEMAEVHPGASGPRRTAPIGSLQHGEAGPAATLLSGMPGASSWAGSPLC